MSKVIPGTCVLDRHRGMAGAQAEMSRRIGTSASYLNLIERSRRGIAGPLRLRRAAAALELTLDEIATPPSAGRSRVELQVHFCTPTASSAEVNNLVGIQSGSKRYAAPTANAHSTRCSARCSTTTVRR